MKFMKEKTTRTTIDLKSGIIIHEQIERQPSQLGYALGLIPALFWIALKLWFGI